MAGIVSNPTSNGMSISYFRPRRPGPELRIEDAVVAQLDALFGEHVCRWWLGASVPIGAGRPDFVAVSYEERLSALAAVQTDGLLLAYLRSVREARFETIVARLGQPGRTVERELAALRAIDAVWEREGVFSIAPGWRDVLRGIVAIESKVEDWKRAVRQASRNRIFATKSFVALPCKTAQRVSSSPMFQELGIGIISVDDGGSAKITRTATTQATRVWLYYFRLASLVAQQATKQWHTLSQSTMPANSFLASTLCRR